ncbi:MAG: hypothetical protein CMI01_13595 [Oceanospirillaceae bacterium]|nr:hypothetical protein [Oceanospirillaceae bacterium]
MRVFGATDISRIGGILVALTLSLPLSADNERVNIARFSDGSLEGWELKSFKGNTEYRLETDAHKTGLRALSQGTASGLYLERRIDLQQTPILNWSWKLEKPLPGDFNEQSKAGDDYAARIYVVFSGGAFFWRTRAINYVWASSQPKGAVWPNAYTANARMIAVRSDETPEDHWVTERRDVRADYRRLFGEEPDAVDAVAIMTDTDNTGLEARAWYGDIWFTRD